MKYEIVNLKGFTVIGIVRKQSSKENIVPQMWEDFFHNEIYKKINDGLDEDVYVGVAYDFIWSDDKSWECGYIVGKRVNSDEVPEGLGIRVVKDGTFAKFIHKGPLSMLGNTYDFIYGKWLPESEYEYDCSNEVEWYDERFKAESDDSEFDIYVPVRKKQDKN